MVTVKQYMSIEADVWEPPFLVTRKCLIFPKKDTFQLSCAFSERPENTEVAFPSKHNSPITSLCVDAGEHIFCSCSSDCVVLWNLCDEMNNEGKVIGEDLGHIQESCMSCNLEWVALANDLQIWILHLIFSEGKSSVDLLERVQHHATLEGHQVNVIAMEYLFQRPNILVTTGRDNACKVWDVITPILLYQTGPITSHCVTTCVSDYIFDLIAFGTGSGQVLVYHVAFDGFLQKYTSIDMNKSFDCFESVTEKPGPVVVSSKPVWKQRSTIDLTSEDNGKTSCAVLSAKFCCPLQQRKTSDMQLWPNASVICSILSPGSRLVVSTTLGIAVVDCKSWEPSPLVLMFQAPAIPRDKNCFLTLGMASMASFSHSNNKELVCAVQSLTERKKWHFLHLRVSNTKNEPKELSVISCSELDAKSVLRRHHLSEMSASSPYSKEIKGSSLSLLSSKTKSSGYNSVPRMTMFCSKPLPQKKSVLQPVKIKCYPEQDEPPVHMKEKVQLWKTSGTAAKLAFTTEGNFFACASTRNPLYVLPSKGLKEADRLLNLIGHAGPVNSVHFSMNSKWLVSASSDQSAKIWDWKKKRIVLTVDSKKHIVLFPQQTSKPAAMIGAAVTQARFYYMDQFLLLTSRDNLMLYDYVLTSQLEKAKRLQAHNSYKQLGIFQLNCQQITCIAAANQFYSYVVICGCSDKKFRVMDLNSGRVALEMEGVHSRAPYCLVLNEGSKAVSHPPQAYDLFLSSALCDGIKMWDLRSAKCIQKHMSHANRSHCCGLAISPCARFLAAASEDRCVYLYDTRRPVGYLHKVRGLSDVVMDVAFHPSVPTLAAALLDGSVVTFSN